MTFINKTIKRFGNQYQTSYIFRYIILGFALALIPLFSEIGIMANSTVRLFGFTIIFAIVALGLNLLLGFSGLVSLGTAGFMGLGAYLFVFISENVFDGFLIATVLTLIISGVLGSLIAFLSMKVEGIYLAIATLFIGEILLQIFRSVTAFTGGFSGAKIHHPKFNLIFTELTLSRNMTYVLIVVFLILVMIGIYNLVHSKTGRALMAMSRSEHAAQAMGISIIKYRLIAFVSATVLAALGGVLYVSYFRFIEPSAWNLNRSLLIIAMVVVGGFKSIFGTFIGAFIIYGVPELYLKDIFSFNPAFSYIFAGVLIIVVIMFYPYGAVYIGHDIKVQYFKRIYPRRLPYITLKRQYKSNLELLKQDESKSKEDYKNLYAQYKVDKKELRLKIRITRMTPLAKLRNEYKVTRRGFKDDTSKTSKDYSMLKVEYIENRKKIKEQLKQNKIESTDGETNE